jgi:hypothetical protein
LEVVELQNDRIDLAAIDARMVTDVVEHLCPEGSLPRHPGGVRLLPVDIASVAEIGGEAGPAPPLQAVAVSIEAFGGKVMPATSAAPQLTGLPDAQASRGKGVGRSLGWARRSRRLEPADPDAHRRLRDPELARYPREGPAELAA